MLPHLMIDTLGKWLYNHIDIFQCQVYCQLRHLHICIFSVSPFFPLLSLCCVSSCCNYPSRCKTSKPSSYHLLDPLFLYLLLSKLSDWRGGHRWQKGKCPSVLMLPKKIKGYYLEMSWGFHDREMFCLIGRVLAESYIL